jgi:hypothetical protein
MKATGKIQKTLNANTQKHFSYFMWNVKQRENFLPGKSRGSGDPP